MTNAEETKYAKVSKAREVWWKYLKKFAAEVREIEERRRAGHRTAALEELTQMSADFMSGRSHPVTATVEHWDIVVAEGRVFLETLTRLMKARPNAPS